MCDLFGALSQSCSAQGAGSITDKRYSLHCWKNVSHFSLSCTAVNGSFKEGRFFQQKEHNPENSSEENFFPNFNVEHHLGRVPQ